MTPASPHPDAPTASVTPRQLWSVVLLALAVRALWALLIPVVPESDVHAYDTFARNLVQHGVFGWRADEPFAFWAPGAAMFYAAVYWLAGFNYTAVVVANLLLSAALVFFGTRVAARMLGATAGWCCGLILALWPTLVMFTTLLTSELPYLVLATAALDVWTRPGGRPWSNALIAGALLGTAALVRPMALLLPAVFGFVLVCQLGWRRWAVWRQQIVMGLIAVVALLAVVSPWTLRNHQLYGEFILVSTNGGVTLWMGNVPGTKGDFVDLPESMRGLNDYQRNKALGALAKQYIAEDPVGFVARTARKAVLLFSNESIGALWNSGGIRQTFGESAITVFKRLTQLSWAAIMLLALAGLAVGVRRFGFWPFVTSATVMLVLYYTAVHAVVIIGDRYHLVMAPQLAALGGLAIAAFLQRRAARSTPGRVLAELAKRLYAGQHWRWSFVQGLRPYICPFGEVIDLVPPRSRVLDVGCGSGLFLLFLSKLGRLEKGHGFDMSAEAIAAAKQAQRHLDEPGSVEFAVRTVQEGIPSGDWTVVSVVDVIHHIPREYQAGFIEQLCRATPPGARLIIKDMAARPWWRAMANRMHDLLMARQWVQHTGPETVERWVTDPAFTCIHRSRSNMLWYGHWTLVYQRQAAA